MSSPRSSAGGRVSVDLATNRQRLFNALSWASFGIFGVWFATHLIPNLALRLQFEDQLIVLRYARNLAEGNGLVYNAGERVMGFTTPLFTVLSSAFVVLGGDQAAAWQNTFGLLCMLGTAAVAARLLVRLQAGAAAPLAVALITFNPAAAYNYLHVGMEVHLFTLLFLLALDLHLSQRTTAASVVAALLFLTRPEGALLIAMLLAGTWWRERRPPIREAVAWLVAAAPWLTFATIYYGSPVPATLPAKAGALLVHTPQYLNRVAEIYADAATSVAATYSPSLTARPWAWLPLAVLVVGGCAALLRRCQALWPLVAFPVASAVGYGVLGAWAEFTWHYYPLSVLSAFSIAFGAYAATSLVLRIVLWAAQKIRSTSALTEDSTVRRAAVVVLLALSLPVLMSTWRQAHYRVEPSPRGQGLAAMGRALGERFDGTTSVLLDEIGHIGWESRVRIVDQAGLVTPGLRYDVARHLVVERHRPDLLLLHDDAPSRHGVRQTAVFPLDLGYREVADFPAAPRYRLYEFSGDDGIDSPTAGYPYQLQRNESGHIEALVLDYGADSRTPSRRFPVAGRDDGTVGYIEYAKPEQPPPTPSGSTSLTLAGWAADTTDPTDIVEVVIILGDRVVGSTHAGLARPDVAAQLGRPFEYTGFSLRVEEDRERVDREGFLGYALSRRGVASRLRFMYLTLERGRLGGETLPISDGRRLLVQKPGNGVDGAVDILTKEGDRTEVVGWAADLERSERPRQIVIYRDDEFLANLGVNRERRDIAATLADERLLRVGFGAAVPGAPEPATFSERHRVFALMLRGTAVELPILPASTEAP